MEIQVSLSALPPSLYRKYRKGWKPNIALLNLFEKISGKKGHKAMRIYIDAKTDRVVNNLAQNIKPPIQIVDALMEKDIVLVDYLAGTGKDSHGRIVKIGRVLSKNPELKKMFDSDPNRKSMVNATRNRQLICISMHPYDIAGMSTDRGWVSCMNLKTGSNKKFVKQDIAGGTLIAYLIDPSDKNINKPIGRCLAKPYFQQTKAKASERFVGSEKVNALYLVEYAYPDSKMPFVHVLQDWLDEHINPFIAANERKGMYELGSKLYADQRSTQFNYDLESPLLRGDINGFVRGIIDAPRTSNNEEIVVDALDRYPQLAMMFAREKWGQPKFYVRCVAALLGGKHYDDFGRLLDTVFEKFGVDDVVVPRLWSHLSGRTRAMHMFIDRLPQAQRKSFLDANFDEVDLFNMKTEDLTRWSYPAALSQIWSFAKYSVNPESMFWFHASRINTGGVQVRYVDEEYMGSNNMYAEYVLAPAIGSLANMTPACPAANQASMERHEAIIDKRYFSAAKKVFAGYKYIAIDTRSDFRNKLRPMFENKKYKFKISEMHVALYHLDDDLCIAEAREELYPDAIQLGHPLYLLLDTQENPQQIIDAICDRALEIALAQALEEVAEMRVEAKARRARLKAKK
ncbi:hypothetical protein MPK71_gp189 [Erwinia phage pEa_SNUABM_1]|uniref:Uncharacterized protein n=1 Tax=Erwinia phage pEa_SNUABM_1 TaxID=2869543 RepID=A0AAE7XNE0_9CAUD|nr:hypothetical protein MPK71_gp189 [Erwinia phage pEa_SNUABM_1]QZE57398.1 hypothetical protein pEaSNUABM1_00189 [Erwinia phage pEa_SNUABM_1]